jgi:DNA polymerase-3 subunit gamma/tau
MLVQASDQMEDVIDISSENLATLKEQASKADVDTILRYIRIFSELSSQIRYATQKRILIEITLIKLCKPQMENSEGAFEERIRILEQHDEANGKLLKGIQSGQVAVTAGPGSAQAAPAREKKVLDRAVPEDIQKVVSGWSTLLMRMDNPMRTYLQGARLSLGNNDTLQIVFNNRQLTEKYAKGDSAQELQEFLDGQTGKHITYETRFLEQQQEFEENYVDLQAINFDIVTEEKEN